jgi:2-C-methyl-D-erythritol 4-phosphate cytidylyltransferase
MTTRAAVVIPAAGEGRRMGHRSKAFIDLAGEPMLSRAIRPFLADPRIVNVTVALDATNYEDPPVWLSALDPRVHVVEGGARRTDSVRLAIDAVPADVDVIVVHDAARPLVTSDLVSRAIDAAVSGRSVIAAVPLSDTVHRTDTENGIVETPDRTGLWRAQTPQAFPAAILREAHRSALADGFDGTDDAMIVARAGIRVHVIDGDVANMKITVPQDVAIAEMLLRIRAE